MTELAEFESAETSAEDAARQRDDGRKAWLSLANSAYRTSTDYFDANIRAQMEKNLRRFQSKHQVGSKYTSEVWKNKAKFFRPKTRATVRKNMAAAAVAYFSTADVLSVTARDDGNPRAQASAALWNEAMNYRLQNSVPWFLTLIGAYQESQVMGVVVSYQSWDWDNDRPDAELRPTENIRFDPAANWRDPIGTSPYLIDLVPFYAHQVREKAEQGIWLPVSDADLVAARTTDYDTTRAAREKTRNDPKQPTTSVEEFDVVWVRRVILRWKGRDLQYYTLGEAALLSEPVPVTEAYPHLKNGMRPYVLGIAEIEVHRNYPSAPVELYAPIQDETNDLVNQRMDNVRLVLNKRWFVKRNRNVDIRSLTRNVPGSVSMMDDPASDVVPQEWNDVTGSSYNEQDRLNMDFDDISGTFSGSSVASNRRLNETVGGMNLLSSEANQMGDYQLKTFSETWVEPVLRQMLLLEQYYETDQVVLALAGGKAQLIERFGIDLIDDDLLRQELTMTINVGMGATNPLTNVQNFMTGMDALQRVFGETVARRLDFNEVVSELFGKLGHKDGKRFLLDEEDQRVAQLNDRIAELEQQVSQKRSPMLDRADANLRAAQAVKTLVEAFFGATQAGEKVAMLPEVAPVADSVLEAAGYTRPTPPGVDPNIPAPEAPTLPMEPTQPNTSPLEPATGFDDVNEGIEGGIS